MSVPKAHTLTTTPATTLRALEAARNGLLLLRAGCCADIAGSGIAVSAPEEGDVNTDDDTAAASAAPCADADGRSMRSGCDAAMRRL